MLTVSGNLHFSLIFLLGRVDADGTSIEDANENNKSNLWNCVCGRILERNSVRLLSIGGSKHWHKRAYLANRYQVDEPPLACDFCIRQYHKLKKAGMYS